MAIECEHGQLARSCNLCQYEWEIAELKEQINTLEYETIQHGIIGTQKDTIKAMETEIAMLKALSKIQGENVQMHWKRHAEMKAEIERLRKALERISEIENCECGFPCDCYSWRSFVQIARDAVTGIEKSKEG